MHLNVLDVQIEIDRRGIAPTVDTDRVPYEMVAAQRLLAAFERCRKSPKDCHDQLVLEDDSRSATVALVCETGRSADANLAKATTVEYYRHLQNTWKSASIWNRTGASVALIFSECSMNRTLMTQMLGQSRRSRKKWSPETGNVNLSCAT